VGSRIDPCVLAISGPADLHFGAAIDAYQQVPLYRFSETGERIHNVTDWALRLFEKTYGKRGLLTPGHTAETAPRKGGRRPASARALTKENIFHYVYAVLYDPVYRDTYALNLRREFPRIPFYQDLWKWSDWGKELMQLHVGYESIDPLPLKRLDKPPKQGGLWQTPKVLLKGDKAKGIIHVDSETSLSGVPAEAWEYKLGNLCALDWVLDQHKERKPRDPVIAASFNTYRLATFKDSVIDLIGRVTRLSVETVRITEEMRVAAR
jgi:predicted helicase